MRTREYYSRTQIVLHWAIAVLIVANYFISDEMGRAFRSSLAGNATSGFVPNFHVYAGSLVLVLAVIRFGLRWVRGAPAVEGEGLMNKLAELAHWALYALMIGVPALGVITWFGGIRMTADLHVLAMDAMMLLILLHAGAAIFHHYVLKDGLLRRMTRTS